MKILTLLPALVAFAAPAAAQNAAPANTVAATDPAGGQCELHIWPAERFQAMTSGWGAAFGVLGALADSAGHAEGDKARRSHLASALDSEGQVAALQQLDLIKVLQLPQARVIAHNEPLDRKTIKKIKTRRAVSSSPCYSELIVTDVLYTKSAMLGRSLQTGFMLRQFGAAPSAPLIKSSVGGNGLKIFPAKENEDTTAADAELVSVFLKNFEEASHKIAKKSGGR